MFTITCFTCFLELPLVETRIVDDGPVAYCLTVSYTSGMTLDGTESDKFNDLPLVYGWNQGEVSNFRQQQIHFQA